MLENATLCSKVYNIEAHKLLFYCTNKSFLMVH